jgi:subtilisin family serine protease
VKYSNSGMKSTQVNATYNLDRLDQDNLPLDNTYKYKSDGGKGVTVYVLDSGLRLSHVEFEGRATCGYDALLGNESNIPCDDLFGHGTHVAGTIGGKTVGVAKQVSIVAVKVTPAPENGVLQLGPLLAGLQYVLEQKRLNPSKPMIINMSLTGPKQRTMDAIIKKLLELGVTVVAAAGNSGDNACFYSPAGTPGVITVGASDELDQVPRWSNDGTCVDLYAPGVNIISAGRRDDNRYKVDEGTSQSSPAVAGAAALYLQIQPTLTPAQVLRLIVKDAVKNALLLGPEGDDDVNTSEYVVHITNNRLLHTGIFTDDVPQRKNPACPYTGKLFFLCAKEGWLK